MKLTPIAILVLLAGQAYGQLVLNQYDMPNRGETYFRKVVTNISSANIPTSVFDSTTTEKYWDFSNITDPTFPDTANYYWVEGTPAAFDFPDANMADFNPDGGGQYMYFIKNETGFYLSGQSSNLNTGMGNFDIKAEFRPAAPIIKVPAKLGDEVSGTSRASVDLLTFGKIKITTNVHYIINGYGTVKIPGGEENQVLRIKRITETEAIISIAFGPTEITDTTTTFETAYEFYTNGYGDAIAKVSITSDPNLGLDVTNFTYKEQRIRSNVSSAIAPLQNMILIVSQEAGKILVKDEDLTNGGSIEIYNINGELMASTNAKNSVEALEIGHLSPGTYIVKTQGNNGIAESKTFFIAQ